MALIGSPQELLESDVYIDVSPIVGRQLHLKCEGFNFAGSIKLRAAAAMVEALRRQRQLGPDSILIESSSGNMGVALSVVAADRRLPFICVTDSRCNLQSIRTMRALGADVVVIDQPSADGGYLGARLAHVRDACARDPRLVWLNQYANPANALAHYESTAPAIAKHYPQLDVLFVGAGTTGTLMGCALYFREFANNVTVVAVDAVGSVAFSSASARRLIPGLGAAVPPPLLDRALVSDHVLVLEANTLRMCRALATRGWLLGGSSGTVVCGALDWLAEHDPEGQLVAVAISADLGHGYLDTVYNDAWVQANFGGPLAEELTAVAGARTVV